jgi:hypothetical protein
LRDNPLVSWLDFQIRLRRLLPGTRPIGLTLIFGLAAGTAAVAFQLAMNGLYRATLVQLARQHTWVFLLGSFLTAVLTGPASNLAGFGEPKQGPRLAEAAGAAAGLAAVFNTPLAAVTFLFQRWTRVLVSFAQ